MCAVGCASALVWFVSIVIHFFERNSWIFIILPFFYSSFSSPWTANCLMVRPYAFDHFLCICQAVYYKYSNTKLQHKKVAWGRIVDCIHSRSLSLFLAQAHAHKAVLFSLLGKSFWIVNICYQATTYSTNTIASNPISVDSYGQIVKKISNRVYNPCSIANRHMIWMCTMYIPYGIFLKIIDNK